MKVIMFQKQFSPKVVTGKKRQTIRKRARCRQGDELSLRRWADKPYRSKHVRLLDGVVCTGIERIEIDVRGVTLFGRRERLIEGDPALSEFAREDGFTGWVEMRNWFLETHGLPFRGEVIKWGKPSTANTTHEPPA